MHDRLSPLQREILDDFFELAPHFYLTGGAALAGFHLGHRTTHDLDLFVEEDRLEEGDAALADVARALGATSERLQAAPSFRRFLVRRGEESVLVDLVRDPTPRGSPVAEVGVVRVDPPEEIFANKLCSLLSRAEIRDLVDVRALERVGFSLQDALRLAMRKDSGLTPAQLGWVLSEIEIGDDARIPGGGSPGELRDYLGDLRARLARLALPK
jgi:hypothetical protein